MESEEELGEDGAEEEGAGRVEKRWVEEEEEDEEEGDEEGEESAG